MFKNELPEWRNIHTIIFDFDGVFTDNKVWVDQDGCESVRCDRRDGLGFDLLRGFARENQWDLRYFILSMEKNKVVTARARKLGIECKHGVSNKKNFVQNYLASYYPSNKISSGLIYLGNDLNDLGAMELANFSVVPSDAHPIVLAKADLVLPQKGGQGFVRSFIELLLRLEQLTIQQIDNLVSLPNS